MLTRHSAVANRSRSASHNSPSCQTRTCTECLLCQITYVGNSRKTQQNLFYEILQTMQHML